MNLKQAWASEKKQILLIFSVAFLISLFLEIAIGYREYPLTALTQKAFYLTFLSNLLVIGAVPIIIALISAQLLTLTSILLRAKKHYESQYFVSWLLLVTFTYYMAVMAIHKHDGLDGLVQQCESKARQPLSDCPARAINVYPKIQRCLVLPLGKKRRACLEKCLGEL